MSRRLILSIALLFLVATFVLYFPKVVGAFLPDDETRDRAIGTNVRQSKTHEAITKAFCLQHHELRSGRCISCAGV